MHYNCLIVDDEEPLAESTCEYFNMFDVKTHYCLDETSCYNFLAENTVDLVLLDINLIESSGFSVCKKLRETTQVPILFISARSSDSDILIALSIGGDDYIRKPYSLSILLAKVKAVLKRYSSMIPNTEIYENKNFRIDFTKKRVNAFGEEVHLKAMEYKLLSYLVQNKGRVISKEELFEKVWEDVITGDGTLNVHIRHLREKLERDPNKPEFITTLWGRGYFFEDAMQR